MFKRILNQLSLIWDFKNPEVVDLKNDGDDDDDDVEKGTNKMKLNETNDPFIV